VKAPTWPLATAASLAATLIWHPTVAGQPEIGTWLSQTYRPSPADNPLKGFLPFRGAYTRFPHSMEWSYIPWKALQQDYQRFDWTPLDDVLADAASRGHQIAFRIYADYPNQSYAVPDFLSTVAKHPYDDYSNGTAATSYVPNYDDRDLVRAMISFIEHLGSRYDGDPRIGFITVGLIGFWGEWHTFRPSCGCDDWMPSGATERQVIDAFNRSFHQTRLLLRFPDVGWQGEPFGFHDDAFASQTMDPPEWTFVGRLKRSGALAQWKVAPIGGELSPDVQSCTFSTIRCNPAGQDFETSVQSTHASWLINHFAFETGYSDDDKARAIEGARHLGYELFVTAVQLRDARGADGLTVSIKIRSTGVAPFYYDWPVQLAAADSANRIVAIYDTSWHLSRIMPYENDVELTYSERNPGLSPGRYKILMRAINPLAAGKPLVLANAAWGQDAPNWLTLGSIEASPN